MVAKMKKVERNGSAEAVPTTPSHHSRRRSFNKPSWLLCTIADLDERMKMLMSTLPKEDSAHSFAERANAYYNKRPQLLALLQDLYNDYLSLADRYCQSLAKNGRRRSRSTSPVSFDENKQSDQGLGNQIIESDTESSLSFQPPSPLPAKVNVDIMVADMVMNMMDYEILSNELHKAELRCSESARKIELQKNLLDVLESERLILLNDNATLSYRLSALGEENKGLVSESLFLKSRAAELARCLLKTREDQRVFVLSRKIEDLQTQIHGLEKRNKEYYEQLVKQMEESNKSKKKKSKVRDQVNLDDCYKPQGGGSGGAASCENSGTEGARVSKLWNRVKKMDLFNCGHHFNSSSSQSEKN